VEIDPQGAQGMEDPAFLNYLRTQGTIFPDDDDFDKAATPSTDVERWSEQTKNLGSG
jgi:hypothetical protein